MSNSPDTNSPDTNYPDYFSDTDIPGSGTEETKSESPPPTVPSTTQESSFKENLNNDKDRRISELEDKLNLMMKLMLKKNETGSKQDDKVEEEPTTMSDIIGVSDFRANNRNDAQIEQAGTSSVSAKDRGTLSVSEKTKLFKDATRGISPDKFKPLIDLSGLDSLLTMDNIVGFNSLNDDLQKFLLQYGLTNVFYILKFDYFGELKNPATYGHAAINYLDNPQAATLKDVIKTSDYLLKRGSVYHVENLRWTYEAIMNSCNQDLRTILKSKMEKYEKTHRTGPILYAHLLEQLTSSSPDAVRKVTQNIVDLTMDKFIGESIPMACKTIRACYKWLDVVHKMPADPETIVLNILATCTVPEFLRYLESLKTHAELNDTSGTTLTVQYLLTKAEDKYRDLVLTSKWDISGTGATFYQSPSSTNNENSARKILFAPPKDGESEVKNISGQDYKFCTKCRRWNKGSRAHTTSEHIVGRRRDADNRSTGEETTRSERSENSNDGRTRHPNAQSHHFQRVSFLGGI
jgi:hypothetical protein